MGLIKYWLPSVLTVTLIGTMRDNRWNPYGGFEQSYLVVGILVFVLMVFVVFIVAFYPQFMTQAVDASGVYDNIDKKTEIMKVIDEDNEDNDDELIKVVDDEKKENESDKKYEKLVNNKQEIELAEEVNPDKAKENQTGSIEEELPKYDNKDDDDELIKVVDDEKKENESDKKYEKLVKKKS